MGAGPANDVGARRRAASPPPYGLIALARDPNEPDERWGNGFRWQPEDCGGDLDVLDPCGSVAKAEQAAAAEVSWEPVAIIAEDRCAPFGFGDRERVARARRKLLAGQERALADELWRGTRSRAAGFGNRYLAHDDSDVLTDGATSVASGIACLDQGLSEGHGSQGMIHLTPQVLTLAVGENMLVREGGVWLSPNGHVVVASPGYDGSGPPNDPDGVPTAAADGSVWAYATDLIDVRLGAVTVTPPEAAEGAVAWQGMDRDVNTVVTRAERLAAAAWDLCRHFAVELDVVLCDIAGPGS